MNDDVRAAILRFRRWEFDGLDAEDHREIVAHIDGEPARREQAIANAEAKLREQRATDRELALRAATLFINMMTPGEPFGTSDMSRFDSCLRSVWGEP